jgi:hypothetical protein
MDRRLGIGLAVALGVALLVIAFLLGRGTRPAAPLVVVMTPTPALPAAPAAPGAPTAMPGVATDTPAPWAPSAEVPAPTTAPQIAPPIDSAPTPAGTVDPARAEVARYFAEIEAIQEQGGGGGDPQAVANEILKQATSGNTQGFDELVAANERMLAKLRAVQAPAACAAHLQRTIEVVERSRGLLDKTRAALGGQDIGNIGALASEGQELDRRARELDAQATQIKKAYGL